MTTDNDQAKVPRAAPLVVAGGSSPPPPRRQTQWAPTLEDDISAGGSGRCRRLAAEAAVARLVEPQATLTGYGAPLDRVERRRARSAVLRGPKSRERRRKVLRAAAVAEACPVVASPAKPSTTWTCSTAASVSNAAAAAATWKELRRHPHDDASAGQKEAAAVGTRAIPGRQVQLAFGSVARQRIRNAGDSMSTSEIRAVTRAMQLRDERERARLTAEEEQERRAYPDLVRARLAELHRNPSAWEEAEDWLLRAAWRTDLDSVLRVRCLLELGKLFARRRTSGGSGCCSPNANQSKDASELSTAVLDAPDGRKYLAGNPLASLDLAQLCRTQLGLDDIADAILEELERAALCRTNDTAGISGSRRRSSTPLGSTAVVSAAKCVDGTSSKGRRFPSRSDGNAIQRGTGTDEFAYVYVDLAEWRWRQGRFTESRSLMAKARAVEPVIERDPRTVTRRYLWGEGSTAAAAESAGATKFEQLPLNLMCIEDRGNTGDGGHGRDHSKAAAALGLAAELSRRPTRSSSASCCRCHIRRTQTAEQSRGVPQRRGASATAKTAWCSNGDFHENSVQQNLPHHILREVDRLGFVPAFVSAGVALAPSPPVKSTAISVCPFDDSEVPSDGFSYSESTYSDDRIRQNQPLPWEDPDPHDQQQVQEQKPQREQQQHGQVHQGTQSQQPSELVAFSRLASAAVAGRHISVGRRFRVRVVGGDDCNENSDGENKANVGTEETG
eukprot:TRINITY_DN33758_c0_g1_i1.p1 TRINITY_DN33758_c0_g1~~TRINITY_DN33758_c0_g1_i1.p1  ORF type:complete len:729 (-),score=94.67 TRINITY_DN33758_c0_g1_i1:195-2381(-)